LCENRQQQSCKAFIGLSVHAEMIGGNVPFYTEIWPKLTHALAVVTVGNGTGTKCTAKWLKSKP